MVNVGFIPEVTSSSAIAPVLRLLAPAKLRIILWITPVIDHIPEKSLDFCSVTPGRDVFFRVLLTGKHKKQSC